MERYNPEFKPFRRDSSSFDHSRERRGCRRQTFMESRCLLEQPNQANRRKIHCSLYSSTYEETIGKTAKFFEPLIIRSNESSVVYGPPKEFSKDLSSLLSNPVFSDVTIKCGDEKLKAHKNILSSRSPVFNAMFHNSMVESATGVVTIDDLDPETVVNLLVFMYSNKVENLSLIKACGLLEASTKYQVLTLRDICVDFLIETLSRENALLVLQKADLFDEKLKCSAISFICENFFDLRVTEEWMLLQKENPVLCLEVCNMVIDKLYGKQ